MSKIIPSRTAQYPLYKEQVVNFDDYLQANTSGSTPGPTFAAGGSIPLTLPPNSRIIGGSVVVETGFGAGVTLDVGDVNSSGRYVNDGDISAAAVIQIPAQAFVNYAGDDIAIKLAAGAPTAGKLRVGVMYVTDGKVSENQIA